MKRMLEEGREAGEDGMEGPPVPIPNTEVKLHHADDTWRATAWKIRYLPASFSKKEQIQKCICSFFMLLA